MILAVKMLDPVALQTSDWQPLSKQRFAALGVNGHLGILILLLAFFLPLFLALLLAFLLIVLFGHCLLLLWDISIER
jgi:hypothetical protein